MMAHASPENGAPFISRVKNVDEDLSATLSKPGWMQNSTGSDQKLGRPRPQKSWPTQSTVAVSMPPLLPGTNMMMLDPAAGSTTDNNSSLVNGSFHPDFLFCGACADCHEDDGADNKNNNNEQYGEEKKLESYLEEGWDMFDESTSSMTLQTTFQLRQPLSSNSSSSLVIQTILQPIPGVQKVAVETNAISDPDGDEATNDTNISTVPLSRSTLVVIHHDASVHADYILNVLESAGHSSIVTENAGVVANNNYTITINNDKDNWVRSQFYVAGICCATEIPAVKKIVKPIRGVSKLNINLTTKVVHVQHDTSKVQAQDIANALTRQGFATQLQRDGAHMAQVKQLAMKSHQGRTTLHIQGVLRDRDVPHIQSTLRRVPGIVRIGVNVAEGVVYVDHDIQVVSSVACAAHLSETGNYNCSVAIAAERAAGDATAAALDHIGRSRYVESTLAIEGLQADEVGTLETAFAKNFIRAQVRAIYPNVLSGTVKVEHDPKLASLEDICAVLGSVGELTTPKVLVDGADANLYLPLQEDYPQNQGLYGGEPSLLKIHANVWLSGIFWLCSMIGYVDGKEWFEYFGLLSVLFGLPPIVVKAWRTVKRFQFDANCMMVTASLGALALGEFDEAASVAFLFAVSEFLEATATKKARNALSAICALRPDHANVIHPVTKEIVVVPADRVPLGSLVSVRTGDKIATDGVIVEGSSAVDESSLTGESTPAHKKSGDKVSGGTINIGQTQLVVRTTSTVEDSAVSRLIRLVEEAQSNRSPTEKMIDTFARSYTPTVILMAALMCTIPWAFGSEVGRYWTLNGLIIIVIACPCALTISTPVTYAAGLAATAQRGIIIKGGAKLEAMGSVDRIVFDKTGTLTKGKFSVIHLEVIGNSKTRQEMLEILALIQERSSHPISSSLVQAAKEEGVKIPRHISITDHQILKGEGITAKINAKTQVFVGNERLFNRLSMFEALPPNYRSLVHQWGNSGGTVGFIGSREDGIIGMFCVKDAVREDAKAVIHGFKEAHIDTLICTGDSDNAAQAVAREIGIPSGCVNSQMLPEDKLHFVGSLRRPQPKNFGLCRQKRYVLFCGDGVNDAPALAVADIGVSMGEGAAMALEMSDVTLMDSRLTKLSYAIKMGQRVLRTVKENIVISLIAKLGVVGLTFGGKMTLLYAIAADVGIMLLVTLNGMKLLPGKSTEPMGFMEVTDLRTRRRRSRKCTDGVGASTAFELVGSSDDSRESFDTIGSDFSVDQQEAVVEIV